MHAPCALPFNSFACYVHRRLYAKQIESMPDSADNMSQEERQRCFDTAQQKHMALVTAGAGLMASAKGGWQGAGHEQDILAWGAHGQGMSMAPKPVWPNTHLP